jgi:hypothetical protein
VPHGTIGAGHYGFTVQRRSWGLRPGNAQFLDWLRGALLELGVAGSPTAIYPGLDIRERVPAEPQVAVARSARIATEASDFQVGSHKND